jgi:predicted permease
VAALEVLGIVAPVFMLIGLGWLLGSLRRIDVTSLTEVVVYLSGPALVFRALTHDRLELAEIGVLASGSLFIVLAVGGMVALAARGVGRRPGALYLPAMFMNAGNMLLPLSLFAFGPEGLRKAAVIFATMCLLQSTLGVAIASGRRDFREALRLPYIYAVAAAFGLRALDLAVPKLLERPIELVADTAVPLMLLALGLRLRTVVIGSLTRPLLITVARVGGGYAAASVFVWTMGIHDTTRAVLLLASVMPAAVVNFVFAEKYGNESGDVATAVFASTVVSIFTTPLVLAFGI